MEVQITDFENAAFAVFVVLLSRAILHFNLNLYIPISKVPWCLLAIHCVLRALYDEMLTCYASPGGREHDTRAATGRRAVRAVLLPQGRLPLDILAPLQRRLVDAELPDQ